MSSGECPTGRYPHSSPDMCLHISLQQVVETPKLLYLIMEYAPAGTLLDFVRSSKRLPEKDAAYILQQIVHGLMYCHRREVVHR